jgi:uncharacterized membrane protein
MPENATRWIVKRNCSASPRQFAFVFTSVLALSSVIGAGFAACGLWMVLPFVGLELIAVAAAFICYGRHAADFETIEINQGQVRIEQVLGARSSTWQLATPQVRIETGAHAGMRGRVRLFVVAAGDRIEIGTHLLEERRRQLARELKRALRSEVRIAAA